VATDDCLELGGAKQVQHRIEGGKGNRHQRCDEATGYNHVTERTTSATRSHIAVAHAMRNGYWRTKLVKSVAVCIEVQMEHDKQAQEQAGVKANVGDASDHHLTHEQEHPWVRW